MMQQQQWRQQQQQGRPVVTPSPDEEDTPAASDCTIVSERGYPVDTTLPNLDRVPQTPPSEGSRRGGAAFVPRPPKGSLGRQGLAAPRAPPRWSQHPPIQGKARHHAQPGTQPGTTAKWMPKQTTAPTGAGKSTSQGTAPWGRGVQPKGKRPGHYNEETGQWEGRNKGRARAGWPANQ